MKRLLFPGCILFMLAFLPFCDEGIQDDSPFSFKKILEKEYTKGEGGAVDITTEQSVETNGDISRDGNYIFYSSNRESGNYDIYMRDLNGIMAVRLTSHPSKDSGPAVSPDGKYLAFVSNREDPEGDIYVVKIDPRDLLEEAAGNSGAALSIDEDASNLSLYQDPQTKTIRIIKDSTPAWSPDGKKIAFSSKREYGPGGGDGPENIWIMDRSGKNKKQLTSKGGMYPSFSPDGTKIIFVSYRDPGSNGDIYILDTAAATEKRVTETPYIELHPSFTASDSVIIYSLIDSDSDKNGTIDLKDNSVMVSRDLKSGTSFELTVPSYSSFNSRWLPVFRSKSYDGIVLFSKLESGNINISMVPETGTLPLKSDPRQQYNFSRDFLEIYNDTGSYILALKSINRVFSDKKDKSSMVYRSRAYYDAGLFHIKSGDAGKSAEALKGLGELAARNFYSSALRDSLEAALKGASLTAPLEKSLSVIASGPVPEDGDFYRWFLMEDLAAGYISAGGNIRASAVMEEIIRGGKDFSRINAVHLRYSILNDRNFNAGLSASAAYVLREGSAEQKIEMKKFLVSLSEKEAVSASGIAGDLKKYEGDKDIVPLLEYLRAYAAFRLEDFKTSAEITDRLLGELRKTDILYYYASILRGEAAQGLNDPEGKAENTALAVDSYRKAFRDGAFPQKVEWLISYYENAGERAENEGSLKKAVSLYGDYSRLMTSVHNMKIYKKLYADYGARSHVLYIDSYLALKGDSGILELEEKYNENLDKARLDFDRAYIYGLSYICLKKGLYLEKQKDIEGFISSFGRALTHTGWALSFDDSFAEPYILHSWMNQYIDLRRRKHGDEHEKEISRVFPAFLFEKNIGILEKALAVNNESLYPENEGNIHLNMGNNYFLLKNYPRALYHFERARALKKSYGSLVEEAIFSFHYGYALWQDARLEDAEKQMNRALFIYESLAAGRNVKKYKTQIMTLYRYFALFSRVSGDYRPAIRWYNETLNFSAAHKIEIDRARYLQEIAFCHSELNEYDLAVSYLERAAALLEKYPEDSAKYMLTISLFGVLDIPVYDLGPDGAVIGETKIFTSLDTRMKKLLNTSLLEEMAEKKGDYAGAIRYLRLKEKMFQKGETSLDVQGRLFAMNNLAYYFFRAGRYDDSVKKFHEALDFSVSEDVKILSGTLAVLKNLSDLYSFFIERGTVIKDPETELNRMTGIIEKFRLGYENELYLEKLIALNETAEADGKKVTPAELSAIKEETAAETAVVYYDIDLSLSVLKFYRAELLHNRLYPVRGADALPRADFLAERERIFGMYLETYRGFENAYKNVPEGKSGKFRIKLMLNMASCLTRLGSLEEAYVLYIDALKAAESSAFRDLEFSISRRLGDFLREYGSHVEGETALAAAADYYKKAIDISRASIFDFADDPDLLGRLYDSYSDALILSGYPGDAFLNNENRYAHLAAVYVFRQGAKLRDFEDNADYSQYLAKSLSIKGLNDKISSLLVSGLSAASPEVAEALSGIESLEKERGLILSSAVKRNPLLRGYLSPLEARVSKDSRHVIVSLYKYSGGFCAWQVSAGRAVFRDFSKDAEALNTQALSSYISRAGEGRRVYVILNETALELIQKGIFAPADCGSFMYAPSAVSAAYFSKAAYSRPLELFDFAGALPENAAAGDYLRYSLIADAGQETVLTPALMFEANMSPAAVLLRGRPLNSAVIPLIESALYSGANNVFISAENPLPELAQRIKNGETAELNSLKGVFAIGAYSVSGSGDALSADTAAAEYSLYENSLKRSDLRRALVHLYRWNSLPKDKSPADFDEKLIELRTAACEYTEALALAEKQLSRQDAPAEKTARALVRKIFLLFASGNAGAARSLLESPASGALSKYGDLQVFGIISEMPSFAQGEALRRFGLIDPAAAFVTEKGRLALLLARYCRIYGLSDATELAAQARNFPVSAEDRLAAGIISGSIFPYWGGGLAGMMAGLYDFNVSPELFREKALFLSRREGRFDRLSVFALQAALEFYRGRNLSSGALSFFSSFDFNELPSGAGNIAAIDFLEGLKDLYLTLSPREAFDVAGIIVKAAEDAGLPQIRDRAVYNRAYVLAYAGNYSEALSVLAANDKNVPVQSPVYAPHQLLAAVCEMAAGNYAVAEQRKNLAAGDSALKSLINSKIELKKISDIAAVRAPLKSDGEKFGKEFLQAVDMLEKNPGEARDRITARLADELYDAYIRFKYQTNDRLEALSFSEMKKQFIFRSKFPPAVYAGGAADIFPSDNPALAASLLSSSPLIYRDGRIRNIPFDRLASGIDANTVLFSLMKNGDDIFVWILENKSIKSLALKSGWAELEKILSSYDGAMSTFSAMAGLSAGLDELFSPLKEFYSDKKIIIICADNYLERVPYELIGRENLLDETHTLVYLSSLVSGFRNAGPLIPEITVRPGDDQSIAWNLESTAIRQSGIRIKPAGRGLIHLAPQLSYNIFAGTLYAGDGPLRPETVSSPYLYLSSADLNSAGYGELSLFVSLMGVQGAVINDSAVKDINSAVFVEKFYLELSRGVKPFNAFSAAKAAVRQKREYAHPAYWTGIRFYMNSL